MITMIICLIIVCFFMLFSNMSFDAVSYITMAINLYVFIVFMRKYRRNNLICFEFFFSIAFYVSLYSYFWIKDLSTGYSISLILDKINNTKSFTTATIVSTLAYLFFIIGCIIAHNHKDVRKMRQYTYSKSIESISCLLFLIVFSLFMIFNYSDYMIVKSGAEVDNAGSWIQWLNMSFLLYSVIVFMNGRAIGVSSLRSFIKSKPFYFVLLVILVIIHLSSGHRHHSLTVLLSIVFLFTLCIRKLPNSVLVIGVFGSYLLFSIIGFTRQGTAVNEIEFNAFSMFRDFSTASLATPFFIEYTDQYGFTWGSNYLLQLTSVIPFLSGIILNLGFTPSPSSYDLYTNVAQNGNIASGFGTSLVGDIYYTFGLFGLILAFFGLGYIVSWLFKRISLNQSHSVYETILFIVLISNSVFMPRSDLLSWLRSASLICIVYFMLEGLFKRSFR